MSNRGTYRVGLIFNTDNEVERLADRFADDAPIDLVRFDEAFQRAKLKEGENGQEAIPDGYYDTLVEEVRLTKTPRTGNPMVIWKLRIVSEDFHARTLNKTRIITEKTLQFLKDDLERCGVHLERLSDLSLHLDEMFGLKINVLKKTKDQWTDIYFVKVEKPEPESTPF
ncbi:MAG: DUF669 domain-containing protein [Bryobacteraceae bacterium]|jgi:hypothetical protein